MGTFTFFTGPLSLRTGVTDGSCFFFVVNAVVAVVVFRSGGLTFAGEARKFGESFFAVDAIAAVLVVVVFCTGGLTFATGEAFGESFDSI